MVSICHCFSLTHWGIGKGVHNGFMGQYYAHSYFLTIFVFRVWIHLPRFKDDTISMNSLGNAVLTQKLPERSHPDPQVNNTPIHPSNTPGCHKAPETESGWWEFALPPLCKTAELQVYHLSLPNVSLRWVVAPRRPALAGDMQRSWPSCSQSGADITSPRLARFPLWGCQSSTFCDN